MDYRRVAELYDPRRRVGGTGYLIQSNLVLTAHHVIAPNGETAPLGTPYDLRFIGDFEAGRTEWRTMGCHLCWDKPEYDLALLKLAEDGLAFLRPKPSITLFGKLGGETLSAKGYGFPRVQTIENRQNPEPLEGRLSRLAGLKEQQLRLQVTSPVPDRPEEWEGISGTSVFVEDYLVGVIIETNKSFAEKALWAVPISIVADDDDFRRFVLGHRDAPLLFIEVPRPDRPRSVDLDANVGMGGQFRRNRSDMLTRVRRDWITGYLGDSLDQLPYIALHLEINQEAAYRPSNPLVHRRTRTSQPVPPGTRLRQIFANSGNALLILGEPGAGKTILLLELARDLLDQAEQDERHPIPVVFLLASWAEKQSAFADWLVDALNKQYNVPPDLGQSWVDDRLILPLLDGLDEVAADQREACVEAINDFLAEHGPLPSLVVCCRVADYEALTGRLRLPSAVVIGSLTEQQVKNYVEQAGTALVGLQTVLQNDAHLWKVLNTPLMLTIAILAYQGHTRDEIHAAGTLEQLFVVYTDSMFRHHSELTPYTREQTEHWLSWLARTLKDHKQSMLYLEWMQPEWLPERNQWLVKCLLGVMLGVLCWLCVLLAVLPVGVSAAVEGWQGEWVFALLSGALVCGLGGGLLGGLDGLLDRRVSGRLKVVSTRFEALLIAFLGILQFFDPSSHRIKRVEQLQWSWFAFRYKWFHRLLKRLLGSLFFMPLYMLLGRDEFSSLRENLLFSLSIVLGIGMVVGLGGGLLDGFTTGEIKTRSVPNEGMKRSLKNALISGMGGALLVSVACAPLGWLLLGLPDAWVGVGMAGSFAGLGIGLLCGGWAYLEHLAMRLVLRLKNFTPLHYIRFLDYATAHIFLRKVGGGYKFVHDMLLEHFAAKYQPSAEQQKLKP
jgi:hypothetical protein